MGDDAVDGPHAIEHGGGSGSVDINELPTKLLSDDGNKEVSNGGFVRTVTTARPDGLVREVKTNKVVSREEIEERLETENVQHLGDFSDEVSSSYFVLFYFIINQLVTSCAASAAKIYTCVGTCK